MVCLIFFLNHFPTVFRILTCFELMDSFSYGISNIMHDHCLLSSAQKKGLLSELPEEDDEVYCLL